jgi:hypothetical protein
MSELRKVIENVVPELISRIVHRKVLYWAYGLITAYVAIGFFGIGDVFGLIIISAPVLLLFATRFWGLANVPALLLGICAAGALFPAFMVGMYQQNDEMPAGLILVGYLMFLVWMAAFPVLLDKLDEQYHLSLYPDSGATSVPKEDRNELSQYRVLLVNLWAATMVMLVVGASLAALLCLFALLRQRRWTAAVAAVACLLDPVVAYEYGSGLVVSFDPIEIVAGLLAAKQWYEAYKSLLWDRRFRMAF